MDKNQECRANRNELGSIFKPQINLSIFNKHHVTKSSCFSTGTEYEGNYINDKRHGHGIFKMADGSVFEVSLISIVCFLLTP